MMIDDDWGSSGDLLLGNVPHQRVFHIGESSGGWHMWQEMFERVTYQRVTYQRVTYQRVTYQRETTQSHHSNTITIQGLLERSWLVGVLPLEILTSYILSQFLVIVMQVG